MMRAIKWAAFLGALLLLLVFLPGQRAQATGTVSVVFNADGGLVNGQDFVTFTGTPGTPLTLPGDPTLTDGVFHGWYTGVNGTGVKLTAPAVYPAEGTVYYAYYTLNYNMTKVWRASQPQYMPPAGQNEFDVGLQLLKYYTPDRSFVTAAAPEATLQKGVYTYGWSNLNRYYDADNTILAKYTVREIIQPDFYNQTLYSLAWWYDDVNHKLINSWLPVILNGNNSLPCKLDWNAQAFIDLDTPDYSNTNFPYKVNCNAYGDAVSGYFVVHHWMSGYEGVGALNWRLPIATDAEIFNGELRIQLPAGTNWTFNYQQRPDGSWPIGIVSPQWRFDLISSLPAESYTLMTTGLEVITFDADTLVIRFPHMPAKSAYMISFSGTPKQAYQPGDQYVLSADFTADYHCLKAVKNWIGEPKEGAEVIFELLRNGESLSDAADAMFQGMLNQSMDRHQLTAWINSKVSDFPLIWAVMRSKTFNSYWHDNTSYVFTEAEVARLSQDLRALYTQMVVYPQTEAAWTGLPYGQEFSVREVSMPSGALPQGEPVYSVDGTISGLVNGAEQTLVQKESYTFTNVAPPATNRVSVPVTAQKTLKGGSLKAGAFSFSLYDAQGNLLQTAVNDEKGLVSFAERTFSKTGTFIYTVEETAGQDKSIVYDRTKYRIIVTIEQKNGELTSAVGLEKDGVPFAGPLAFTNRAQAPKTGDFRFNLMLISGASALVLLGVVLFLRRRNR